MYPNPQDVLPLPPRPNLEQYKKQAKDLVKACKSGTPDAIREWVVNWLDALARLQQATITADLRASMDRRVDQIERFAREKLTGSGTPDANCGLTDAHFVIARAHGFESWPKFAKHLEGLACAASPVSNFEAAAEAIVTGDVATLERLLREEPALIRARSTREHRAMLLHYVAANGVENYRQQTPSNAARIAEMLLEAGAEVDAEAEVYGGGCTTLGLVATSVHPERAGVQDALMQILIDHGAAIDYPGGAGNRHYLVNGCLANGRPAAAEYLAARGARLDLEGAAGIGRLDLVKSFFNPGGTLKPTATDEQMRAGFAWACGYGRTAIVEFMLDQGMPLDAMLGHGQTGLHAAAIGGHADIVKLLLERHAPVNVIDKSYNGTPLSWALHGWGEAPAGAARECYYEVVALLVRAGVTVNPRWFADDPDRKPFADTLRADARMLAALRGEVVDHS